MHRRISGPAKVCLGAPLNANKIAIMNAARSTRTERRLAAILAADVAGYSRLMGADEEGTLAALKRVRAELGDPKIAEHRGRIVKTTGDGMLVEFASVVDAVRCAVEVQQGMAARNADVAAERRIEFRIGINLGDIISDDNDIYGDGVNVAARLEALAEPGGICVSAVVRDQVRDKLDVAFDDRGEQQVKNIARPVHVFRIGLKSPHPNPPPQAGEGSALALPDKPSLAVLPFQNMSGDPEQEYFADGMVEEITTAIARLPWLFVIARNSSFTYKGKAVDVKQVARELGVRYVLEGSVRKAANRVRITGQLIDTATGAHIWADRFDGALDDIFELQDQVASSVAGAIEPRLRQSEIERASRKPTKALMPTTSICARWRNSIAIPTRGSPRRSPCSSGLWQSIRPTRRPPRWWAGVVSFRGFRGGEHFRRPTYPQPFVWPDRHLKPSATMPRPWRGLRSRYSILLAKRQWRWRGLIAPWRSIPTWPLPGERERPSTRCVTSPSRRSKRAIGRCA
jgi:TolB-like protein/class 3 adenylate cyclase